MFHVVLFEPEIPANTGNIIRLCANTGARLHLIRPLGFFLDDRRLRRAGLDYREWTDVAIHDDYARFSAQIAPARVFALSTRGAQSHCEPAFKPGDALLFGPETRGLPESLLASVARERRLRIPMQTGSRSINLANAVAIVLYEAWRQVAFAGAGGHGRFNANTTTP